MDRATGLARVHEAVEEKRATSRLNCLCAGPSADSQRYSRVLHSADNGVKRTRSRTEQLGPRPVARNRPSPCLWAATCALMLASICGYLCPSVGVCTVRACARREVRAGPCGSVRPCIRLCLCLCLSLCPSVRVCVCLWRLRKHLCGAVRGVKWAVGRDCKVPCGLVLRSRHHVLRAGHPNAPLAPSGLGVSSRVDEEQRTGRKRARTSWTVWTLQRWRAPARPSPRRGKKALQTAGALRLSPPLPWSKEANNERSSRLTPLVAGPTCRPRHRGTSCCARRRCAGGSGVPSEAVRAARAPVLFLSSA